MRQPPKGWREWKAGQRRWAALRARQPRKPWLQLVRDNYDWLYRGEG